MRFFANSYLDFDGTLVRENSSVVLTSILFTRARTRRQRLVTWWCTGPLRRVATLSFMTLSLILGGIDAKLLVVLWAFRDLLADQGNLIFNETASRLTLNTDVLARIDQPTTILSLGLAPVIEAFLGLNPDIQVATLVASEFSASRRGPKVKLLSIGDKVKHLHLSGETAYLTDYDHEVSVLQAIYPRLKVTKLELPEAGIIYKVEHTNA